MVLDHMTWIAAVSLSSMIVCVGVSLVAGVYGYYGALLWTAIAIAYFEVSCIT